jgi:transcriptional regulator with XRE-family HTH domain
MPSEKRLTAAGQLFGDRLKDLREKRGLSQRALASMAELPDTHISAMERGLALPNLLTVIRLAAALHCKVTALTSAFDKSDLASLLPK